MTLATGSRNERFKQGKALRRRRRARRMRDLKGPLSRNAVAILAESDAIGSRARAGTLRAHEPTRSRFCAAPPP